MDRIKEGIIEVDGILLGADTTVEDLEKLDVDKAVFRDHPHGYVEAIFNHPIESDGVSFEVSMRISKKGKKVIVLDPKLKQEMDDVMDESREDHEICEEWLKRNMDVPASRDTEDGIFYDFPWGHISSSAAEHVHFGHLEGCILITYGDDFE